MNERSFEDRATIAEAARRVGVHPNTVRRLIRAGRLSAELTRGRHGDTWIVDAAELQRIVGQGRPPIDVAPAHAGPASASSAPGGPSEIAVGVDLSLDRARALERYTHGLLQPLVDLLRERDAAVESRDALLRTQAERIGRLERELELLRAERAARAARAPFAAPSPSLRSTAAPTTPATVVATTAPAAPAAPGARPADALPQQVTTLASQVGRLRADLQLIAAALQAGGGAAPPPNGNSPAEPVTAPALAGEHPPPRGVSEPAPDVETAAVTPEELAGLFPVARRGRLTLEPLEPLDPEAAPSAPPATATPDAPPGPAGAAVAVAAGHPAAAAVTRPLPPDDPFAAAEAAVEELRRRLAPTEAAEGALPAAAPPAPAASAPAQEASAAPAASEPARRRRWWLW